MFAWFDLEESAFRNSEFIQKHRSKGLPVHVTNDTEISMDIRVVPDS
jgi:hypothetical protein